MNEKEPIVRGGNRQGVVFRWGDELSETDREQSSDKENKARSYSSVAELLEAEKVEEIKRLKGLADLFESIQGK